MEEVPAEIHEKGVQTLTPIFRRYSKAQLWIAGDGNLECRLRRMAEGCPNIRFMGRTPYHQLHSIYRNAVAVIVPSLFYEISPLVMVEAAQHKTPVIARNLGGMPEIVAGSGGASNQLSLLFADSCREAFQSASQDSCRFEFLRRAVTSPNPGGRSAKALS